MSNNQKSDIVNVNKIFYGLGLCEDKLKYFYNIFKNGSLFILKIDVEIKGMKIQKIFNEIYYPLYNKTPSFLWKIENKNLLYNKKAECFCEIKLKLPFIDDIEFNKDELIKKFTDIKKMANLGIMKGLKLSLISFV